MFKVKRPIGESENALPVQIGSAFVTDLLLRALIAAVLPAVSMSL
jgi:hypothetical protein